MFISVAEFGDGIFLLGTVKKNFQFTSWIWQRNYYILTLYTVTPMTTIFCYYHDSNNAINDESASKLVRENEALQK